MLCYLTGMEPYYIQCIKDGPFQPKTADGANKPESQWTPDKRRVVNQDQRLKSIIISCLPDDIMESAISSKTSETLSRTYTRYKTLLNELANDGVTLSKHEINVSNPKPVTSSVPTEVKTNDQESKINELTKLVQILMDEKINSTQKPQEPKFVSSQPESSKSVNSSKQSQDSKPNGKNPYSSKPVRPKPLQKPKLLDIRKRLGHPVYFTVVTFGNGSGNKPNM
ncbi:hypothetical protein Tco_0953289 [Tanacetum coccineum]|uniref:Uncharacterized protein n=1 Tax=Tanacetum coccineum TaxID=301880 RepID=A0ABQ5E436_9ASTR